MNVFVDIGNSAIKWAFGPSRTNTLSTSRDRVIHFESSGRLAHADPSDAIERDFLPQLQQLDAATITWWVSSVRPQSAVRFQQRVMSAFPASDWRKIEHSMVPMVLDVVSPDRLGIDRILAAYAVSAHLNQGQHALFIDCGTATTVNWVDDRGTFRGGVIFPGIWTQVAALAEAAEQLPNLKIPEDYPAEAFGRSTQEAILRGIMRGHEHAVRGHVADIQKQIDQPARIWFTGGGLISHQLKKELDASEAPQLVLAGAARLANHLDGTF